MEFNYATLSLPILIASTVSKGHSVVKSAKKTKRIWAWRDRTENLRYLKCILNLATMGFIAKSTNSYYELYWLRQNFVLPFRTHAAIAIDAHLIILQDVGINSEGSYVRMKEQVLDFVESNSLNYFMPTFWVQRNTRGDVSGWFYCWYCGLTDPLMPFRCFPLESCPRDMVQVYDNTVQKGKNIHWFIRQDGAYILPKRQTVSPQARTIIGPLLHSQGARKYL